MLQRNAAVELVMNGSFPVDEGAVRRGQDRRWYWLGRFELRGDHGAFGCAGQDCRIPPGWLSSGCARRGLHPLVALLRRRLSDDEVIAVATELISTGGAPVQGTDVRVAITKRTDELPSPEDTERVKRRLAAVGWPVSDPFGSPD
jgi:hypothetical protein